MTYNLHSHGLITRHQEVRSKLYISVIVTREVANPASFSGRSASTTDGSATLIARERPITPVLAWPAI